MYMPPPYSKNSVDAQVPILPATTCVPYMVIRRTHLCILSTVSYPS